MHEVASSLNKAKRELFFDVAVADWDHRLGDCPTGDSLQKDILGWLSPPDSWKNYHTACESRLRGTAEWFIHGNTFLEWRMCEVPSSLLWVHGKRSLIPGFCGPTETNILFGFPAGAGKSVFWYVIFLYFHLGNLIFSPAPQSLTTSMRCGKLDSHR